MASDGFETREREAEAEPLGERRDAGPATPRRGVWRKLLAPIQSAWSFLLRARPDVWPAGTQPDLTPRFGWRSVTGNTRLTNEDRCFVDPRRRVFLVADGVGGYLGGAEASQIVRDTASRELIRTLETTASQTAPAIRDAIRRAIRAAQREIAEFAKGRPQYQKMGSTVILGALLQNRLHLGHVGDSRAYLIRGRQIRQLTTDQTYVQLLLSAGAITHDEAQRHPLRNVLLNSLNAGRLEEDPEIVTTRLAAGDRLLLTTDGLTDVVDDETIKWTILAEDQPQAAADRLVQKALDNQSKDNVTCIVVELGGVVCPTPEAEAAKAALLTQSCAN